MHGRRTIAGEALQRLCRFWLKAKVPTDRRLQADVEFHNRAARSDDTAANKRLHTFQNAAGGRRGSPVSRIVGSQTSLPVVNGLNRIDGASSEEHQVLRGATTFVSDGALLRATPKRLNILPIGRIGVARPNKGARVAGVSSPRAH